MNEINRNEFNIFNEFETQGVVIDFNKEDMSDEELVNLITKAELAVEWLKMKRITRKMFDAVKRGDNVYLVIADGKELLK